LEDGVTSIHSTRVFRGICLAGLLGRRPSSSLEAKKVLLPLKVLAYGVAHHCFGDYFQVVSKPIAIECYNQFLFVISHLLYLNKKYLALPSLLIYKTILLPFTRESIMV
jgi:hypothetical protein